MRTSDQNADWLTWVETWLVAAARQVQRIDAAKYEDMEPDVLMFVQAINNVRRGAEKILGKNHPDLENFDKATPHLKNLRDMLEHFDEYAAGTGRRQRENKMRYPAPFKAMYQKSVTPGFKYATIVLADSFIVVHQAYEETAALVLAARLAVVHPHAAS